MEEPELWASNDDKNVFRVARHDTYIGIVTVYRAEIQGEKGTVEVRRLNGFWQSPVMMDISKRELNASDVEVISNCISGRSKWRFASELMNLRHGVDWIVEAGERGNYAVTIWATGNRRESEEPEALEKCFNELVLVGSTWW